MKENKLFRVLRRLSKEEFQRLLDFIHSPFFNKRTDTVKFFDFLKPGFPEFGYEYTSGVKIYNTVYGDNKFSKQVVKNLFCRISVLLDSFLKQLGMERDNFASNSILINELGKKGEVKAADKLLDENITSIDISETYTVSYLKQLYDYLELKNDLISLKGISYEEKILNSNLRGDSAVNYFLMALLRIANEYAAFNYVQMDMEKQKLYNNFFEFFDFEKYIEKLKEKKSPYYASMAVYYFGLLSKISDPDGTYREKLKQIVFENLNTLRTTDKHECWSMIFAAYIFTNTAQQTDHSSELHTVNKFFVDSGIMVLDENGYVFKNNYHNIAMQAMAAGDFEWTNEFIEKYKDKLPPDFREDTYGLCLGLYYFNKNDFGKCISVFSKINAYDINANIIIRSTYIKCYYELEYFDEAESAIDAFRNFLKERKGLTPQVRRPLPAFIRYAKLLVRIKSLQKKISTEYFVRAKKADSFHSKKWILEKMEELL